MSRGGPGVRLLVTKSAVRQPAHWALGLSNALRDGTLGWAAVGVVHTCAEDGIIAGVSPLGTSHALHPTGPGAKGMLR